MSNQIKAWQTRFVTADIDCEVDHCDDEESDAGEDNGDGEPDVEDEDGADAETTFGCTPASWAAAPSLRVNHEALAPIGQEAQPAADHRTCAAAEAVTGSQRVRDIDRGPRNSYRGNIYGKPAASTPAGFPFHWPYCCD
jgi:hypothetical protein